MHEHVLVKVNACVDEKIAPLVEALNSIEGIVTIESCQEWFPDEACVLFYNGLNPSDWNMLGEVCFKISTLIREHAPDSGCITSLEWRGSNSQPWGRLAVNPDYINDAACAISLLSPVASC